MTVVLRGPGGTERRFALEGPLLLGRSGGAGLRLDGPEISRRHARLTPDGGAVVVEDLGSANGVRVGGVRIAGPAALLPGAVARVGRWELEVEGGVAPGPVPRRRAGRRLVAAGASAALLVVGSAALATALDGDSPGLAEGDEGGTAFAPAPPAGALAPAGFAEGNGGREARAFPVPGTANALRSIAAEGPGSARARREARALALAGHRFRCAEALREGDWANGRAEARAALALDPFDREAREAAAAADREETHGRRVEEARIAGEQGRDDEALATLLAVPQESWYGPGARAEARRLVERITPKLRSTCAGRGRAAAAACRRFLDLTCHRGADPAIRARLARLDRRATWSCPEELAARLGDGDPADGIAAALRERWREPALVEALLAHFRDGRPRTALAALARTGGAGAAELVRRIGRIDGRLREARSHLLAGRLSAAGAALEAAAAEETAVADLRSPVLVSARAELAAAHLADARAHAEGGRAGLAAEALRQALAAGADGPEAAALGARLGVDGEDRSPSRAKRAAAVRTGSVAADAASLDTTSRVASRPTPGAGLPPAQGAF